MPKSNSKKGYVDVIDGKYKTNGKFHKIEKNEPIFNKDTGKLAGVTNPRDMTYIHSYGGEAIFFESLGKGKLIASRCENKECGTSYNSIFMPFRIFCPDCLHKTSIFDLTDIARKTARIHSFIVTHRSGAFNTLKLPIKFINVEFEGVCTILMSYLSTGNPEIGMRVVPIFKTKNPTYTIIDLSFVSEGTPQSKLPEDFSF